MMFTVCFYTRAYTVYLYNHIYIYTHTIMLYTCVCVDSDATTIIETVNLNVAFRGKVAYLFVPLQRAWI